ncbi:glycoside hydrolase family 28 protein [Flammeovirgaceae bacterium SG7u.111]|nr:glycoside hydrolase family 28 protein [Flammeovirgaceae bacterium SG7u.132]WPO36295.1 glycoside hydrolase family 28 protein [Flammeovirgaceae bacterium SG7u.111]
MKNPLKKWKGRMVMAGLALYLFSCNTSSPVNAPQLVEKDNIYAGIEFEMPKVKEASFKDYSVKITDFGAVGDGITNNKEAITSTIEMAAKKGGGKVIIPRGVWLTGPIQLKSNINLHLEDGALLVFSKDFDEYPLIETSFEGLDTYRCISPIYGKDLTNIAITGKGIIDGSGDAWRPVKKSKLTENQWNKLVKSGGVLSENKQTWYPSESSRKGDQKDNFNVPNFDDPKEFEKVKDFMRPVLLSLVDCKKVLLDGPTFQNSPAWNLHPLMCEDVIIRNLTVKNPWYSQNGDGLDLESCKNALIYNNTFDVGDDAICIKSGKNEDGRKRGMPTENVIIKNNIVFHGHGGFTIGSEMSGGVKKMHISNCTFIGTDIGLRFKSTRGRGGVVEDIFISKIDMMNIPAEAIKFNSFYEGKSPVDTKGGKNNIEDTEEDLPPVTEETPAFKNISLKEIHVSNSEIAAFFQGLPEKHLSNISLENSTFEVNKGMFLINSDAFTMKGIDIKLQKGKALTIFNCNDVTVDALAADIVENKGQHVISIEGKTNKHINITNSSIDPSLISGLEK